MSYDYTKVCPVCKKKYWTNNQFQTCCSRSCASLLREYKKREKALQDDRHLIDIFRSVPNDDKCVVTGLQSVESKNKELFDAAKEASDLGMSYGRYSAMKDKKGKD